MYCKYLLLLLLLINVSCNDSNQEKSLNTSSKIIGETITFTNYEENYLIKNKVKEVKLYSFDKGRNKVFYKENIDYVIDNNKIRRTKGSSIPNFDFHKVVLNWNNDFTFASSPRNPELNIKYQIFADYYFYDSELLEGNYNSNFLSNTIKEKLKNKKKIKIAVVGTSISAGIHTLASFYEESDKDTYTYLVAKAINIKFGSQVQIDNFSKSGSSLEYLEKSYDNIIKGHYDLIFIEFGMNDHITYGWFIGLPKFERRMESIIKKSRESNQNIVMVGFFQQNPSWDLEFMGSTASYNNSLANIANDYNYYFVDIKKEFSKYSQTKINSDLCGDYMHHPTTFGHKLYYKTLMPIFFEDAVSDGALYKLIN